MSVIKLFKKSTVLSTRLSAKVGVAHVGLSVPVVTRWGTLYASAKKLLSLRYPLESVAFAVKQDISHKVLKLNPKQRTTWIRIMDLILNPEFWNKLDLVARVLCGPSTFTTMLESNQASCADVMAGFAALHRDYMTLPDSIRAQVNQALSKRWSQLYHPVYLVAYLLHPQYHTRGLSPLARSTACNDARTLFAQFFPNMTDENKSRFSAQLEDLVNLRGNFADKKSFDKSPNKFWEPMLESKELCLFARRVLSISPTAAAPERCWSLMALIDTKQRNRMHAETAADWAFVGWCVRDASKTKKAGPQLDPIHARLVRVIAHDFKLELDEDKIAEELKAYPDAVVPGVGGGEEDLQVHGGKGGIEATVVTDGDESDMSEDVGVETGVGRPADNGVCSARKDLLTLIATGVEDAEEQAAIELGTLVTDRFDAVSAKAQKRLVSERFSHLLSSAASDQA